MNDYKDINFNDWFNNFLRPKASPLENIGNVNRTLNAYVSPHQGQFNFSEDPSGFNIGGAIGALSGVAGLYNDTYNNLKVDPIEANRFQANTKGNLLSQGNNFALQGGYKDSLGKINVAGSALSSATKGATIGSVAGPIGTAVGGILGGALGLFSSSKGNEKRRAAERKATDTAIQNFSGMNNLINQNNISNWQSNQLAYGGILPMTREVNDLLALKGNNIFAYGGDFSNGVNYFGTGNNHETNPLGGIPVGISQNGEPNLVEEGEVKWNDYIFSDRLKVSKPGKMFLPDSLVKKSFADAAMEIAKESEERPNDPISKKGLYDGLGKLMMMQEGVKMKKEGMEGNMFAEGGDLNSRGTPINQRVIKRDTQNPLYREEKLREAYRKAGISNPAMIESLIAQDKHESRLKPQGKNNFSNITSGSSWKGKTMEGKDHDGKGNPITQKFREYDSIDNYAKDKIDLLTRLYDFNQNDSPEQFAAKLDGDNKSNRRWAEDPEYGRKMVNVFGGDFNQMPSSYYKGYDERMNNITKEAGVEDTTQGVDNTPPISTQAPQYNTNSPRNVEQENYYKGLLELEREKFNRSNEQLGNDRRLQENMYNNIMAEANRPNTLRYSPLFAQLATLGSVMSQPADRLNLGRISPQPISERLSYSPIDDSYLMNRVHQQGAGMYRGLMDSSGGNRGIAQASALAHSRNITDSLGQAYMQGAEFNRQERSRVGDFNRSTSMFNAQQDLAGQEYNVNAQNQEALWNKQADAARRNMLYQGIATIGNTLGAIGTENRFFRMAPVLSGGYNSMGMFGKNREGFAQGGFMKFYKKKIK